MVKPGYKQTEIGVIPEDWEVAPLGSISCFHDSKRVPIRESDRVKMQGDYPYYGASGIIDYVNDYIFDGDYILLGEDGANIIDRSSRLAFVVSGKCWINNHAHVIEPHENINIYFLSEYLESITYDEYNTGTAQPKLNREKCNMIPVPVPSLVEQLQIAKILEDCDGLIVTLEKEIIKKKAIKQGAMQELLTGKKRLPGFADKWIKRTIGDIACIESGGTPSTTVGSYWNGKISWCTPTDITENRSKYIRNTEKTITKEGVLNSSAKLLPKGTILLCTRATIGESSIATDVITTNQGFKNLVCNDDVYNEFLYYALQMKKTEMVSLAIGSTFLEISKNALSGILIDLPDNKDEQVAIAGVLSDIDEEIELLEQKLAKHRQLKQGLMQQLLTGRIRIYERR
ncbi:MAG: restriction endonuclease subunit S [Oscillospiraceae bacterium]|nr:restriction endonuclease subunit S [Oscillospiraceae bacterium]